MRKSIAGFEAVSTDATAAYRWTTLCFFGGMAAVAVLDRVRPESGAVALRSCYLKSSLCNLALWQPAGKQNSMLCRAAAGAAAAAAAAKAPAAAAKKEEGKK